MQQAAQLALLADRGDGVAICILDKDGQVTGWNRGAEAVLGWSEAEIVGQHFSIFHSGGDGKVAQGWAATVLASVADGETFEDECSLTHCDGSSFPARISIAALRGANGASVGFGYVMRNNSALRAAEFAIETGEMQLRAILRTLPDALIVIDEQGIVREFSAAAEAMFGYARSDIVGANISMLMPAPDRDAHDGYLAWYRKTGERHMIGTRRRTYGLRSDGTIFPVDLAVGEAIGGGVRLFTGILHDRTEQERGELQLNSLQSELLHVSRVSAMGTMAATLAHELNQPITAVANYLETCLDLLEKPDGEALGVVREALGEAVTQALRAGEIISRLRRFVARGDTEKTIEPIAGLIEEACALGLAGARERGIRRRVVLDPSIGPVLIDRVQVNQVLVNLLRNAVDAIGSVLDGLITITTRREGDFVQITVEDNGRGFPAELASGLFSAFVTTKREGMGLGLSICRTIVEAHGGRIWAESGEAGGTAFHFTLPCARTEELENDGNEADSSG